MQIIDWLLKMNRFKSLKKFITPRCEEDEYISKDYIKPKLHFKLLNVVDKTPSNELIGADDFIAVVHNNTPYWAMFRCPCGCGVVISLSLQRIHKPSWSVIKSEAGRPSLYPSVWQNNGCCSHFWIKDGRVHWCSNSGIEPWVAEPKYYTIKTT